MPEGNMRRLGVWRFSSRSLLITLTLLVAACVPITTPPITPTQIFIGESIRPTTATPISLGSHSIYILDPRSGDLVSQILIVDMDARREVRRLQTRYTPEITFTPDGKRLYVADSYSSRVIRGDYHDVVSVYDAVTLQLTHDDVDIRKRLLYKALPAGQPYTFLSHDGTRLFVGKYGESDPHALRLAVLDANTFHRLTEFERPNCDLMPLRDGRLLCVRQVQPRLIDPLTGISTDISGSLPTILRSAILSASGERVYLVAPVVTSGGHAVARMTVVDAVHSPPTVIANQIPLDAPLDSDVGFNHVALSPDESRLYVGFLPRTGELAGRGLANEIWVFDLKSWTHVGTIKPNDPVWHIAISNDGKQLYAVNPFARSLMSFDTRTFEPIAVIHDLGDSPARIVVPPK
ncbi:MAG: hypothetical protein HY327_01715 [Chloroflexi bacterium]|nr:hypothetical protein [Chloroflexota bacterium]